MRERDETNWAEAAAAAAVAPAQPDQYIPTEEDEEEEEWLNTSGQEDDRNFEMSHDKTEKRIASSWILKVAIPDHATDDSGEGSASIFIDPGMTAERLGQCIIQAVTAAASYNSIDNNDDSIGRYRGSLVGLFGKDDLVFYSLEFILAMNPLDGEKRTFCVKKPAGRNLKKTNRDIDLSSVFSYTTFENMLSFRVTVILFIAILIARRIDYIHAFWFLLPQDLPSMWRMVSFAVDWPARELYRYGPAIIGWEGRDLIDICTQMNQRYYFVGLGRDGHSYEDRNYWLNNPEACETIYRMKEESFARMCRPLGYLIVGILTFLVIRWLKDEFFARPPGPQLTREDRAVLNTYRAIQMLAREHRQDDRWQQKSKRDVIETS